MRKIPKEIKDLGKSLQIEPKENSEQITQIRKYKLITPLFGGGVSPRENDSSKLVRETSIRGQLRFWWRAIRGSGNLAEMKNREDAIFGSANEKVGQSKISIVVENIKADKPQDLFDYSNKTKSEEIELKKLAYVAFPLQPEKGKNFYVTPNVSFEMKLTYQKEGIYLNENNEKITFPIQPEIEATLWAWETFGGIGGRTRRGFGAIQLTHVDEKLEKLTDVSTVNKMISDKLDNSLFNVDVKTNFDFPVLGNGSSCRLKSFSNADTAWKYGIERLQSFRQYRLKDIKDRNGNVIDQEEDKHGISQWSEAALLRNLVLDDFSKYPKPEVEKFPRSEFGLPINFYFETPRKVRDALSRKTKNGKPEIKLTAQNKDIDRLASPLILRPIECADRKALIVALILKTPRQPKGGFKLENTNLSTNKTELPADAGTLETENPNEFKLLADQGLKPLNGKTDVLQAFLDFFANDGADNRNRK